MIGERILHYKIIEKLGEGGMGVVYKAEDTKLKRTVALKFLPRHVSAGEQEKVRFEHEAQAAAALDHPNICTVYEINEADGRAFIAMAAIEGQSLQDVLQGSSPGGLPQQKVLDYAIQIAEGLQAAHEKNIVHRDIKPGNILITEKGQLKITDFGLAKLAGREQLTREGTSMGTVAYMSPEQAQGENVDHRTDIWALGAVMYEMVTGKLPFVGEYEQVVLYKIMNDEPAPLSTHPAEIRDGLERIITRALAKDPATRHSDASELLDELKALRDGPATPSGRPVRKSVWIAAAAVGVVLITAVGLLVQRNRLLAKQAEDVPRLNQLSIEKKYADAFELAREIEEYAGPDAVTDTMWKRITDIRSVTTEPPGAQVSLQIFGDKRDPWNLGLSPITDIRVPKGPKHWRVEREGYLPAEVVGYSSPKPFVLLPESERDADMVRVPEANVRIWVIAGAKAAQNVPLGAFLIDRHEVTNRAFSAFVQAGGYNRESYWKHAFSDGEKTLSFSEAMQRFRDATGKPGPAGWRLGSYLDGTADLPVTGVSWYEAAAYAEFAGKELPTMYHWYYADNAGDLQLLPGLFLPKSNFETEAPNEAGERCVSGAHGAHNMSGNVREWSATTLGSEHLALGGAWTDPYYIYLIPELRSPLDRDAATGFRCIQRLGEDELSAAAVAPLEPASTRDFSKVSPVSDDVYAIFKRFFETEAVPLDPRFETSPDTSEHWIKRQISFAAGYGNERLLAWLYLPRNAAPPYKTIIQMGGAGTFYRRDSQTESAIFSWTFAENLLRSGRAVLLPLWKGSYERSDGFQPLDTSAPEVREHAVKWVQELRRSVDYLQSREDLDPEGIGFQGISYGAQWAPTFLALEPRIRTGILLVGGLLTAAGDDYFAPEVDPLNHAPRVTVPILMLNGRHDPVFIYETSQVPLYNFLGTPEALKRHVTYPAGHAISSWTDELIRESMGWLDTHLGEPAPIQ